MIHDLLKTSAARLADKDAIVHGDDVLSYSQAWSAASSLARGLRLAGLERGARLAIFLDASIPQTLSIFAASAAHAVFVPIHPVLFPQQVAHILNDCGVQGLVTTESRLAGLANVIKETPSLAFVVVTGDEPASDCSVPVHRFKELCVNDAPIEEEAGAEGDLAAIIYTSGSAGKPNGVMLTQGQITAAAAIVSEYLGLTEHDRILAALPFCFDAGLNQLMTAVREGGTLVLINFTFAREIVDALARERITGLAGVPTLWSLLTHPHSTLSRTPLPHLRYITNTGGVMPQSVLSVLRRTLPDTKIYLMYGFTEAFRSTYLPPEELDRRPTSIGKAIPRTEILIVNDRGEACVPGEVGELVHRGPTVALGYWGNAELTQRKFRSHPFPKADGQPDQVVCYSGDLVKTDGDGYIYFVGRRDALIKSAGFRISPTEVEEVLQQSDGVRLAAVIGIPDEIAGECIKAYVIKSSEELDKESLLRFCSSELPPFMVPRAIEFVNELPMTPNAKVDYNELRRRDVGSQG